MKNLPADRARGARLLVKILHPLDTWSRGDPSPEEDLDKIDWGRCIPFLGMHAVCLFAFLVGVSPVAIGVAIGMYLVRMFAITGIYHRYFSHRTYKTSRFTQFVFAVLGASAVQRGPLWWAAHHRHHHKVSDQPEDVHSPVQHGFLHSHMGWIMTKRNFPTDMSRVRDLSRYPELCFLDRYDTLVPIIVGVGMFGLGVLLEAVAPGLGTSGWQMLIWGFFISTIALFHGTCTINSLSHLIGTQPYKTGDTSRNNFVLALITLGEGWHNNHHYFQGSTRQGFRWWQIDISFYVLKVLSWLGIVWDLHPVPDAVREGGRSNA